MNIDYIKKNISSNKIIYLRETSSTNDVAKELAEKEAEGLVVIADYQSKGRGRHGRAWEGDAGASILLSILLKPQSDLDALTRLGAEVVCKVLSNLVPDKKFYIKKPNDVYVENKKISGILVESSTKGQDLEYAILGIGINVNNKIFSDELKDIATSLYLLTGREFSREEIIIEILKKIEGLYSLMS